METNDNIPTTKEFTLEEAEKFVADKEKELYDIAAQDLNNVLEDWSKRHQFKWYIAGKIEDTGFIGGIALKRIK